MLSDHADGSLLDLRPYFSALLDWGAPDGLVSWCSGEGLTLAVAMEGRQEQPAPSPCPGAQGQWEWAVSVTTPGPPSLRELLPFLLSRWFNNLFLVDIFILNTGKMPAW